jgi:hypothetical protein
MSKTEYCNSKLHLNNGQCVVTHQGWHTCFMKKDHPGKHNCICKAKW